MGFGIVEGHLMLIGSELQNIVHAYYAPTVSICATIMTIGYGAFFVNVAMTVRKGNQPITTLIADQQTSKAG
jgi:hypothetical protein